MTDWLKVSRARPCAICGKPDWCLRAPDGDAHLCNRVESDRPARGGWIHGTPKRTEPVRFGPAPKPMYEAPDFDAALWWRTARLTITDATLAPWADQLGLPDWALATMGATTCCNLLCFPMHDGRGDVCGIRTRTASSDKYAITGSRAGVFLPTVPDVGEVVICEGPTDAAAAMALGFEPIGRPSCQGQELHVVDTLRRWGRKQATICADSDGPGIAGAARLADALRASRILVRMVAPIGHKDLRDWFRAGATREAVDAAWAQQGWM